MSNTPKIILGISTVLLISTGVIFISALQNNKTNGVLTTPNSTPSSLVTVRSPETTTGPTKTNDTDKKQTIADIDSAIKDLKTDDLSNDDFKDFGIIQ